MTALDELFEEMQSIWTVDGKRKQLAHTAQPTRTSLAKHGGPSDQASPILQQGEQYWFSLEDLPVFLLVSQDDQRSNAETSPDC